jgi:hypothetical protein
MITKEFLMKKIVLKTVTSLFLSFMLLPQAFSQTNMPAGDPLLRETLPITEESKPLPALKNHFEVGTEISYIDYKEPDIMEQEGMMYGLFATAEHHDMWKHPAKKNGSWMLKAEGHLNYGQVDYEGSGTMDDIDDFMAEVRGIGGLDLPLSSSWILTPYTGIAYRYLYDDSSGRMTSTGAWGYQRESNYIYSPLGLEATTTLGSGWSLGIAVEYDIFWWGKQISHLSDVNASYNDIENVQTDGFGVRGSFKLTKKGKDIDIIIEPFIRYWDIEKSDEAAMTYYGITIGTGWEPANHSTEIGCRLGIKF